MLQVQELPLWSEWQLPREQDLTKTTPRPPVNSLGVGHDRPKHVQMGPAPKKVENH